MEKGFHSEDRKKLSSICSHTLGEGAIWGRKAMDAPCTLPLKAAEWRPFEQWGEVAGDRELNKGKHLKTAFDDL